MPYECCGNCKHYDPNEHPLLTTTKGYCTYHGCYTSPESTPSREGCKHYDSK